MSNPTSKFRPKNRFDLMLNIRNLAYFFCIMVSLVHFLEYGFACGQWGLYAQYSAISLAFFSAVVYLSCKLTDFIVKKFNPDIETGKLLIFVLVVTMPLTGILLIIGNVDSVFTGWGNCP